MKTISRTRFLKQSGICLALPLFESMAEKVAPSKSDHAKRLFVMSNPLGMVPTSFHPEKGGSDYELPELLMPFKDLKQDISLFSNLDHGLRGGHEMTQTFLSGIQQKEAKSMPHGNVSLDQWVAQAWMGKTRYAYLSTKAGTSRTGGFSSPALSWTPGGINVPPIDQARTLFQKLFVADSAELKKFQAQQFKRHGSILDAIHRRAKAIETKLSKSDQDHLQQYFTAIREIEVKLNWKEHWHQSDKPQVPFEEPQGETLAQSLDSFFELLFWAFKTDLTRVATLEIPGDVSGRDFNVSQSYHTNSHHGRSEEALKSIKVIELFQMEALAKFVDRLKREPEHDQSGSMLSHSLVIFGSGLSNASSHTNSNLPVLLSGGGFRHGQHHLFEEKHSPPLSNLWLSCLHRLGIHDEFFGRSKGTLRGFEA